MKKWLDTALDAKERAKALVEEMTVYERASQLRYDAPAIPRLDVPEYNWWNEALHGVARAGTATMFPQAIGLAAMFDEEFMRNIGDAIAVEGRAKYNAASAHGDRDIYKGLTFWSPNVNIFRDPRWGRGHETYGEDPYLTSRMGVGFVKGLQGEGTQLKSAACAKHFAVHSGPEALRHSFNAVVSKKDIFETYLPAFEALVKEAKVEAVMGAYNRTNGEPCCGSKTLLKDILRDAWGFDGHVVSDCGAISDFHAHHQITDTAPESAALAISNGCDVNCGNTYLQILVALQENLITEDMITTACERLMTTRIRLGLFDKRQPYAEIPYEMNDCPAHHALALEAARRSAVLLRNNGILPLSGIKNIAVIGPNADSRRCLIGNYHGTASRHVTLLDGIRAVAGEDARVFYSEGCDISHDKSEGLSRYKYDRISEALACAEHAEVVILALGLDETLEGEEGDANNAYFSGDKGSLELPLPQRKLLDAMLKYNKPVIVVNFTGSAVDLRAADAHAAAILQAWYPGAEGGQAIAELIFGKCSPSGKLPVTFYNSLDDLPEFADYSMANRTYRYIDADKPPLYPFGYGLTYGKCEVESVEVEDISWPENQRKRSSELRQDKDSDSMYDYPRATLSVRVHNAGDVDTQDVLQIYIRPLESQYAVPNYSLCAMKRVTLAAGEVKTVSVTTGAHAFCVVNDDGQRIVDGSAYKLYAGFSQPDSRSEQLTGTQPVSIIAKL